MTQSARARVRDFIVECLEARSDRNALDDGESLFLSGRLDSLTVTRLVVFLEGNFAVDFGIHQFDVDQLDSIELIAEFADQHGST